MMRNPLRFAPAAVLLLMACSSTSSHLVEDRLTGLGEVRSVALATVEFGYRAWRNRDESDPDLARAQEAEWIRGLRDAFLAEAADEGLAAAESPCKVDITVVHLDPGSKAGRMWGWILQEGIGWVTATARVRGHGEFTMSAVVWGGWSGGEFVDAIDRLGRSMASHIAERAGKQ